MKTLIKPLLVAFSLLFVNVIATQAEVAKPGRRPTSVAPYQSGIFTTRDGKVQIALDKPTGGRVSIQLVNEAGQPVFTQQVGKKQTQARLRLDVSTLPDGDYQLVITNGVDTTTHALKMTTQSPSAPTRLVAVN